MNYSFIIHSWMISDLKLSGNDLLIYANIYQFSSVPGNYFSASLSILANTLNISVSTVQRSLKKLVADGLIEKEDLLINNVKICRYSANLNGVNDNTNNEGIVKMTRGYSQNDHQINTNNTNNTNTLNTTNKSNNTSNQVIRRGSLLNAEKNKENKASKYVRMVKLTKSFILKFNFSNADTKLVENALLDYLNFRVKRGLEPEQWVKILNPLLTLHLTPTTILAKIDNAIAAGYMLLVPSWELEKNTNRPIDNIADEKDDDVDYTPSGVAF